MVIIFVLNSFKVLEPVFNLLPLNSKVTLLACFVKRDMSPLNIFPFSGGIAKGKGFAY